MQLSITLILTIVTVLVSIGGFSNQKLVDDLIFYPPAVSQRNQWYRLFTCGFIHADFGHLFFNMLALYLFGSTVEASFMSLFGDMGKWLYLLMYLTALAVSILPTYFKNKYNYHYKSLGASGAVSAVIFASLLFNPTMQLYVYFFPMRGFIFAPLYLILSSVMDKKGGDNINHSAHLWGALYGFAFILLAARIVDYPILQNAIQEVQYYLQSKGWIN